MEVENRREVAGNTPSIGLPVKQPNGFAFPLALFDLKRSSSESVKVRAERPGFGEPKSTTIAGTIIGKRRSVRNCCPVTRNLESEAISTLQIGLVKAREGGGRPIRDEKRVEIVGVTIQGAVAGNKPDG